MEKNITIEYTPKIDTLMKVSKYLLLQLRFLKFMPIVAVIILLPQVMAYFSTDPNIEKVGFSFSDLITIPTIIVIWIAIYITSLKTMKKNILNNKRNFETQKIVFSSTSYLQEATSFKIENFWSETYQIKETKEWFLIYPKKNTAFPIDKVDLKDNQYDELKTLFNSLNIKKDLK